MQLRRSRHRWEDNIKMDFKEVGYEGIDWIDLVQDMYGWPALVSAVMNIWISSNFLTCWKPIRFSGITLLRGFI